MDVNRKELFSLEAECAVLGSMILDPACIEKAMILLTPNDFWFPQNKIIFSTLLAVHDNIGSEACLVVIRDHLKKTKQMKEIGGVNYLVKLAETTPSAANIKYYAEIVKEFAEKRAIHLHLDEAVRAVGEAATPDDKIAAIQELAGKVHVDIAKDITVIKDHLEDAHKAMYDRRDCVYSGFREIDNIVSGYEGGDIIIIAARPSIGKTSLAISMAVNMVKAGNPVLFFSFEMTKLQLVERIIASESEVSAYRAKMGKLSQDEKDTMSEGMNRIYSGDWPLYFTDYGVNNLQYILSRIMSEQRAHKIKCVFIDYLQMMRTGKKAQSRNYEIGEIVDFLKTVAKRCDIPIVLLCQLNRLAESREDRKPRISDLRDSGEIEQVADVVCLLHREGYYNPAAGDEALILVPKQRRGPVGSATIIFKKHLAKFIEA